jgi:hypothetical protein
MNIDASHPIIKINEKSQHPEIFSLLALVHDTQA